MVYLISFSQASTYNICKRSWAYTYIDQLPRVENYYTYFGSKMHKTIEQSILEGKAKSPEAIVTLAMLESKEATNIKVEEHVKGEVIDGVQARGFVDLIFTSKGESYLYDHKSKASKPKAPTSENWDQVNFYAHITNTENIGISYPQYNLLFEQPVDKSKAEEVYNRVIETGLQAKASLAAGVGGDFEEATVNPNCFFCSFKTRCDAAQEKPFKIDPKTYEKFSDEPFV